MSEVVDNKIRKMCKQAWNVTVRDTYSSEEIGFMAIQCPEYEHYHIQSEGVYIEILNEKNEPCKTGEIGKIVVTDLHNFAMPLIRYFNGDYGEVGETCACGRGLPVIKRILGRSRNMLSLPNGKQRWPLIPHWDFGKLAPIQQYQIIQKTPTHLEFRLVVSRPLMSSEEEAVKNSLLTSSSFEDIKFTLSFSYPDKIERNASGKFEDFMSEVSSLAIRV